MSDTFAPTARPANAAIAWATPKELFCEIPCRNGPPYIIREHRTAEGLARILGVLIDHAEKPSHGRARTVPASHPAIRRPAVTFDETEREAARAALKKAGIT